LKKIVTVVGARPQFIKAAAVSRVIRKTGGIQEVIIHTGQHFDDNMSAIFFQEMDIPLPHHHLEINSLSHGAMTGRMMEKIEAVLLQEKPELVVVYGDTNSTLAGALAAKKLSIRVAHVEAGLRSFNMKMPEEINRILTDRISDLLFCPTENAVANLHLEGFSDFPCQIHQTGDVMYDAALYYGNISAGRSGIIGKLGLSGRKFVLCTVHRQENTDNVENLREIFSALNEIHRETPVVLPLHPRTRKILDQCKIKPAFAPVEPLGYFDIVELLKHCGLVITDSGGMQKEAYFFGKYCITLREETEWTELVTHHFNILAGAHSSSIRKGYSGFMDKTVPTSLPLYGEGDASEKIIHILTNANL
jgi:UDP-GlcNAc3NAcA epimerase